MLDVDEKRNQANLFIRVLFVRCHFRFINDYSNFPADYAEVSTFSKPPSECSGTRSPAPYATTTLVGNNRLITVKNASNQNMYFAGDMYHPQLNRYVHSESYFNPKEKINITENRLGCNTFNPNHHMMAMSTQTAFGTLHGKQQRMKLLRNPANFRIGAPMAGKSNDNINDNTDGNDTDGGQQQEQLYVKIGEMNPTSNGIDYGGMQWMQHQHNKYQLRHISNEADTNTPPMQLQSQTQSQLQEQSNAHENHYRPNNDKDMIYAPSVNRNLINYMSSNKRFDEV